MIEIVNHLQYSLLHLVHFINSMLNSVTAINLTISSYNKDDSSDNIILKQAIFLAIINMMAMVIVINGQPNVKRSIYRPSL